MHLRVRCLAWGLVLVLAACATVSEERVNRAEVRRQLAELRLAKRQLELAMREYQKSIELYDRDPEANFGLSQTYRLKGILDLAEHHLQETLRLDPKHHEARLNLGAVYLEQERWEDAIRENDILIEDPSFLGPARALVNRGWAHYKSGNAEQAERDFRDALSEGGFNDYVHMNLGILYYDRGEVVEAESLYTLLLKGRRHSLGDNHPDTIASLHSLVESLVRQRKFDQAEPLAMECHERYQGVYGSTHRLTREVATIIVDLYDAWGKPEQGAEWRKLASAPDEAAEPSEP